MLFCLHFTYYIRRVNILFCLYISLRNRSFEFTRSSTFVGRVGQEILFVVLACVPPTAKETVRRLKVYRVVKRASYAFRTGAARDV